jgi:hypothetical protein
LNSKTSFGEVGYCSIKDLLAPDFGGETKAGYLLERFIGQNTDLSF